MRVLPFKYDKNLKRYVEYFDHYKFEINDKKDFLDVYICKFDSTGTVKRSYLESYSLDFIDVNTNIVSAFKLILNLTKVLCECDNENTKRYNLFRYFDPYTTEPKLCLEVPKKELMTELMNYPHSVNMINSRYPCDMWNEEIVNTAIGLLTFCDNKTFAAYQYMCSVKDTQYNKYDIFVENCNKIGDRSGTVYISINIPTLYKDYKDMWRMNRLFRTVKDSEPVINPDNERRPYLIDMRSYKYKLYRYIVSGKKTQEKNKIIFMFDLNYFLNPNKECVFCDQDHGIHAISYLGEQGYKVAKQLYYTNFKIFVKNIKNCFVDYTGCKKCSIKRKEQILFITLKY